MTTSDASTITKAQAGRTGSRRYWVWQITMWLTILHTALIGTLTAFAIGFASRGSSFFPGFSFDGTCPIHVELARFMTQPPVLPMLAGFLLVPIAVIACYRASFRKRAIGWLLGYWVPATTICVLLLSSFYILTYTRRPFAGECHSFSEWLTGGLLVCAICLPPLPLTLLAALLTLERKKRPPAVEAGA